MRRLPIALLALTTILVAGCDSLLGPDPEDVHLTVVSEPAGVGGALIVRLTNESGAAIEPRGCDPFEREVGPGWQPVFDGVCIDLLQPLADGESRTYRYDVEVEGRYRARIEFGLDSRVYERITRDVIVGAAQTY